jgi:hypothetical protein
MTTRPKYLRAELVDATTVKLRWRVDNLVAVMASYDECKIETGDSKTGPYTPLGETVDLVADTHLYSYTHTSGDKDTWYRVYFDTPSPGDPSDAVQGNGGGDYVTIAEMRDEGVTESEHDDARVLKAIRDAEADLERTTRRKFYPTQKSIRVDGTGHRMLPLATEVIQIDSIEVLAADYPTTPATDISAATTVVHNRHLTEGLINEDDREAPKLLRPLGSTWPVGRNNIRLTGWWGYTDLERDETPGETSDGSQKPISRGEVPRGVKEVVIGLTIRALPARTDEELGYLLNSYRVLRYKARDEEIQFSAPGRGGTPVGSITGDADLDRKFARYVAPARARLAG